MEDDGDTNYWDSVLLKYFLWPFWVILKNSEIKKIKSGLVIGERHMGHFWVLVIFGAQHLNICTYLFVIIILQRISLKMQRENKRIYNSMGNTDIRIYQNTLNVRLWFVCFIKYKFYLKGKKETRKKTCTCGHNLLVCTHRHTHMNTYLYHKYKMEGIKIIIKTWNSSYWHVH